MSDRAYKIILTLISIALFCVIGLQLLWLRNLLEVKKEELKGKTREALNAVVKQLQKQEDVHLVTENISELLPDSMFSNKIKMLVNHEDMKRKYFVSDTTISTSWSDSVIINEDENGIHTTQTIVRLSPGEKKQTLVVSSETRKNTSKRVKNLKGIVKQLVMEGSSMDKPLPERLNFDSLKNLLNTQLSLLGIEQPFEYALAQGGTNGKLLKQTAAYKNIPPSNEYRVKLFPDDILPHENYLRLYYTDEYGYAFAQLKPLLALSLLFTLIIIGVFVLTLRTVLRQKKLNEMKNDFINNMTHEFKTPIATISIAMDALGNPKVRYDDEKFGYYNKIIKEENTRLNSHVEKVLQMALLDKGGIQLQKSPVHVNELLEQAVRSYELFIEQKGAKVNLALRAEKDVIHGDSFHLLHIMNNLLDNALKYSPGIPELVITTGNKGGRLEVAFADKGMGMDKETQARMFDKFYRAQGGNLHDVKGFGLGLSYVKSMMEAHGGTIEISSELGKGTCITLVFNTYGA